jgi:hypothetical protein
MILGEFRSHVLGRPSTRALALAAGVLTAGLAAGCGGSSSSATPATMHFASRPDLQPPVVNVKQQSGSQAPGYVFIAPKMNAPQQGPEIVDDSGQPVWFDPGQEATDFRVQTYKGKPVLTWWEGPAQAPVLGTGLGDDVIMDSHYRVIARVSAGYGTSTADLHEFQITPKGTALLTAYRVVRRDLSSIGGPANAKVADSIVQEVDIATGRVLFTWHSLGHVAISESEVAVPAKDSDPNAVYDYFHVNSVQLEPNGNLLVSARNTWGVYEISRKTGKVLWRLGGKRSDFTMGPGTRFAWQHDARRRADGTITIFDDESAPPIGKRSRAIRLKLDRKAHTATLVQADSLPGVLAPSQGNVQQLDDGHLFVGWGAVPRYTEFDASGNVVYDATFSDGDDSYRAYRFPWKGTPTTSPSIAVDADGSTVHASWNGATRVARWRVLAGDTAADLHEIGGGPKTGFETAITVTTVEPYFAVEALGPNGKVLGRSAAVKRGGLAID